MTFDKLGFKNRKLSEATDSNSLETTSNYTDQADESTQDVESTKIQGRQLFFVKLFLKLFVKNLYRNSY